MLKLLEKVKSKFDDFIYQNAPPLWNDPYSKINRILNDQAFFNYHIEQISEEIAWLLLLPADKKETLIGWNTSVIQARQEMAYDALKRHQEIYKHVLEYQRDYKETASKHLQSYFSTYKKLEEEIARHDPDWIVSHDVSLARK